MLRFTEVRHPSPPLPYPTFPSPCLFPCLPPSDSLADVARQYYGIPAGYAMALAEQADRRLPPPAVLMPVALAGGRRVTLRLAAHEGEPPLLDATLAAFAQVHGIDVSITTHRAYDASTPSPCLPPLSPPSSLSFPLLPQHTHRGD